MREPSLPIDPVDFPGTPEWCDEQRERKERRERRELEAYEEDLYLGHA